MKKRIIIADDDPMIISLVSLRLEMDDYEVIGIANGNEALAMIRSRPPVLAILDVQMPGKDGISVLRELKRDTATCDLPVMMLTGERDNDTVMDAVGAGACDYMVKPFHPDRLMERVNRMVAAARVGVRMPEMVWEL
jgi:two-component system phosphate regulon response regulator PhoB